jgi:hypothetical protein
MEARLYGFYIQMKFGKLSHPVILLSKLYTKSTKKYRQGGPRP